jgi:hypothetical protein
MGDADRERWGGPEWMPFDVAALLDTPADVLERWESEVGCAMELIIREMADDTARAQRACAWITLRQHGIEVPWVEFTPATLRMRTRTVPAGEGDADPPASAPSDESGPGWTLGPDPSPPGSFLPA